MYAFPDDCVSFERLGDNFVGVSIERTFAYGECDKFTTASSINLVRFPINQVTLLDGSPLQRYGQVAQEMSQGGALNNETLEYSTYNSLPHKRKYTFLNRVPKAMKPTTAIVVSFYTSPESISRVSTIDCCNVKCCQFADCDVILQIRKQFWGQSLENRTNYVYNVLSTSWQQESSGRIKYDFHINGIAVCCMAWYVLHGIPKTSFYRYRSQFEKGVCVYVHGNSGKVKRSLEHTGLARAILQDFVDNNSERMPNKSRTMLDGTREIQMVIPDTYKQVDIMNEINSTLGQLGHERKLSKSSFNRIWNTDYRHVALSKASQFSKCTTCSSLKARLEATKDMQDRAQILVERRLHMTQQLSCRNLYYAWRRYSEMEPEKYVCIIHDKMDQKKTAIPRLATNPKELDAAWQLQVSLVGAITHKHGEGHYGHFVLNGLWPADPNLTIGSLALCLHNLERVDRHEHGDLGNNPLQLYKNSLFDALISRDVLDFHKGTSLKVGNVDNSINTISIETNGDLCQKNGSNLGDCSKNVTWSSTAQIDAKFGIHFQKLPENLLLQMDNCASENKNRYLFAYLSLLVARGVFKTVQLGFLMVGHTHEDVDAMFGRYSEKLRTDKVYTLPHLMEILRTCASSAPSPFLLTQVPNFKGYVDGFLCDGQDELVGHSKPLQFRFLMHGSTPVMQYKVHPKSPDWMPREGGIELWKRDYNGNSMLPSGSPCILPMANHVKDHELVIAGIKSYIRFWERTKTQDKDVPLYYKHVIEY